MFFLFYLNSIGDLFAETCFGKTFFTPKTAMLALFSWKLAAIKTEKNKVK